jgi:hypothetical protein
MRKRSLEVNTIVSVLYQLVVVVCGFILPRCILQAFGSDVNGLVASISQFLAVVALMEMGVGAVVTSELYGPLAEKNWACVSRIVSAADAYFKKIAGALLVYVVGLVVVYPRISSARFDRLFTGSLIVILSVNSFAQYYLGIVDHILLCADQRACISYGSQAVLHLVNTLLCVWLIRMGAGILVVKGVTAGIYLARPILVRMYIRRRYPIDRTAKSGADPLKNKWNAMAQHLSECILDSTDAIVLTAFSTLSNVSIYYVYHLVVYNIKNVFQLADASGVQAVLGQLYATGEKEELERFFAKIECTIHTLVSLVFGITAVMLVPFVAVYTRNVHDANYIQPGFAVLLVLAHAGHCLRLPYFSMIKASGQYKQTQNYFLFSTAANGIVSIVLVSRWGLVGVAIGTLTAMICQTVCLSKYVYQNLLHKNWLNFWKRMALDAMRMGGIFFAGRLFSFESVRYGSWIAMAVKVSAAALGITALVGLIFEREERMRLRRTLEKCSSLFF